MSGLRIEGGGKSGQGTAAGFVITAHCKAGLLGHSGISDLL